MKQQRATQILKRLELRYPLPKPALDWRSAWELLVATVLAAQCTDVRVNKITPGLFASWPDIASMAAADVADIEQTIRSTGLFRNKAKNLKGAAKLIMDEFEGLVPRTMAELVRLPGVARKTANIVLSNAYNINEGIAVDTHVTRLSLRMGLTKHKDAPRIEQDLMPLFPRKSWANVNHFLVYYGREVCPARKPRCSMCELSDICPQNGVKNHA